MADPTTTTPEPDRTVVVIIGDPDGWTIAATISGVVHRTPRPLSRAAEREHLLPLLGLNRDRSRVRLDPENMTDCLALSDAIYNETGVEHDGAAVRDALRTLRGPR
jgi:hypothetical protein